MGFEYTKDQQKVIDLHDRDILVAAAAGSGKTAVLVERIIQMISNEDRKVDIDRLLIVTFTNAAAAEMRERISLAISKKLEECPDSAHLERQSTLIHNAQITTIDSFCLNVLRNNFEDIGLDPAFRVADEGECRLLKEEVMAEMLEEHFQKQEEDFLHLAACYGVGKGKNSLEGSIDKLADFAMSFPWPLSWLKRREEDYQINSVAELEATAWMKAGMNYITSMVQGFASQLQECIDLCNTPDGPYMYGELLDHEKERMEYLAGADSFSESFHRMGAVSFERLPSKKDDTVSIVKREQVKAIRNSVKKELEELRDLFFRLSPEEQINRMKLTGRDAKQLLLLTQEYICLFAAKKREKNIIDFSDMEHLALEILVQEDPDSPGGYRAKEAAIDLRKYYQEIMIDEYQDSNLVQEVLLESISGEADGIYNRFMVGDVKQSIYRFRLARPEIFMEKYETYSLEEGNHQRIDLSRNFRSRTEVVDTVNFIFNRIMGKELGGVEYDTAAQLNYGATYYEPKEGCQTEILIADTENAPKEWNDKELEARMVARRIKELVRDTSFTYKDMVILMRSPSGMDEVFKRVLEEQGIPVYITSKTGYFQTTEIRTIMQLLRVLDNPRYDIPLFGTLHSVFGDFSDEELAEIKAAYGKAGCLYEAVKCAANDGNQKALRFLTFVSEHREKTTYLPIRELLQDILEQTGYLSYVTALPAGEKRRANVEMLLEKAAAFEQTSFHGLFHFIQYIDQLEKYDVDYGEAGTLDETADVVRIMSIHKSKGLEFPVCFVSGMSKKFNTRDSSDTIIADIDLGVGIDAIHPEERTKGKTLLKSVLSRKILMDNQGEELRVLYVALTRAKEKLILTGYMDKATTRIFDYQLDAVREGRLPFGILLGAGNYLDWTLHAMAAEQEMKEYLLHAETGARMPSYFRIMNAEELLNDQIKEEVAAAGMELQLRDYLNASEADDGNATLTSLKKRFDFQYPHKNLQNLYTKTTVSELKMAAMEELDEGSKPLFEEERVIPYIPAFMKEEEKVSGTTRGSAIHRVMELLQLEQVYDADKKLKQSMQAEIRKQMEQFKENKQLSEEFFEAVHPEKIAGFFECSLAERMAKAEGNRKLYREQPFVLGLPASLLNKEFPEEETVLVQGIIDVFFEEDHKLILADYKTDIVREPQELIQRYQTQLDYYAKALRELTGKEVGETWIYSFYLQKEIRL